MYIDSHNEEHAYMERALQLSLMGGTNVSPNPFVGAVIVADGRIIGEGYHRQYGGPHAEVNAVASVKEEDRHLLSRSTMYVTLEPCSHYGKTPPCAELIIRTGIPKVIVAVEDPFLKDKASGIDMMREAGIEVKVGMMREEALHINRRFFTAHTLKRPFILLKWAQSADGFIASADSAPVKFSTPLTEMLMHRERAYYDAIMVGTDTILIDNPRLNCRLWPTRSPEERPCRITFDSPRLSQLECQSDIGFERDKYILKPQNESLADFLHRLYADFGITSLMVEGGTKTLQSFLAEGIFDEVRIETAPTNLGSGIPAPDLYALHLRNISTRFIGCNRITLLSH